MKRTESAGKNSRSSGSSTDRPAGLTSWDHANFALCLRSGDNVDLEVRKLYRVRADKKALAQGFVRIIDESGEDYLYPATSFEPVRLPPRTARILNRLK